jgi:hypothetical protein
MIKKQGLRDWSESYPLLKKYISYRTKSEYISLVRKAFPAIVLHRFTSLEMVSSNESTVSRNTCHIST